MKEFQNKIQTKGSAKADKNDERITEIEKLLPTFAKRKNLGEVVKLMGEKAS
jgi:hypothetical protein